MQHDASLSVGQLASITVENESIVKRIIVETGLGKGPEEYGNVGDISMLQVCVGRLSKLFPDAQIEVLTDSAENLGRYCPEAKPLSNRGRELWFSSGVLPGRYARLAPRRVVSLLSSLRRRVRLRYPNLLKAILFKRLRRQHREPEGEAVIEFVSALQQADLLLMCGAGGFYDGSQRWNLEILDLLEAANRQNIPVVMLGQGFGPLTDPIVRKRASNILPQVDFITLRGGRGSLDLLRSLGVSDSRLQTTGDEALGLVHSARTAERGRALGINIRFLASAKTDEKDIRSIRPVLHEFARRHNAPLIPLPIAMHFGTRDDLAIKQLLIGFDEHSDGGKSLNTPLKVIRQAGLCRVVVTGAYHAAVFSLGQGVPVVALAKSEYFAMKMLGLQDMFGEGCQVVLLDQPNLPERLLSAIEKAWQNADEVRESLRASALSQIELSKASYDRIKAIIADTGERTTDEFVGCACAETKAHLQSSILN